MGWFMEQGKNQGPMYVLMILLLGGSGLNLNKSDAINQKLSDLNAWRGITEYRINQLEQRED
ncbi:hypothetical protein [Endozoicomonas atrinae]|uniref:hypothetical protein n=1 Tax=Endozoicomonas atrinae TaxID=1333660 RepID=UPI00082453A6|nr:hypothetical protein [Endozoicomonas atrinae]